MSGTAVPGGLREIEGTPADGTGHSEPSLVREEPAKSFVNQSSPGDDGGGHPGECLTHRRGGEVESVSAMLESAQAISSAPMAASRRVEETVDEKTPSCPNSGCETGDSEPERAATGDLAPCDAKRIQPASVAVLTTVAQVRAALQHARKEGHKDAVVWGRCARCGRVGQVVCFDGVLRGRARAP